MTRPPSVVDDLLDAITSEPEDDAPQLVIADLLMAEGDPRGELIVLDHRERAGQLDDPLAIEQLLLLVAEYGFPRANPTPPPPLPFERRTGTVTAYGLVHEGSRYLATYANGELRLERESAVPVPDPRAGSDDDDDDDENWPQYGLPTIYDYDLTTAAWDSWTETETHVILAVLSDALRAGTPLETLQFPYMFMPVPHHDTWPLRCYRLPKDFTGPRGILGDRYGLTARDYHRWHRIWNDTLTKKP